MPTWSFAEPEYGKDSMRAQSESESAQCSQAMLLACCINKSTPLPSSSNLPNVTCMCAKFCLQPGHNQVVQTQCASTHLVPLLHQCCLPNATLGSCPSCHERKNGPDRQPARCAVVGQNTSSHNSQQQLMQECCMLHMEGPEEAETQHIIQA